MSGPIVVTGASGYIAKHIVRQLLDAGHHVRATIRSPGREGELREAVLEGPDDPRAQRLTFATLDLEKDTGWAAAMAGASALVHTASPFPMIQPRDENDLIRPALEGTVRALKAASEAGIERVVLTSSVASVVYGTTKASAYDESDWTNTDHPKNTAYINSKTLAERAAWAFVERDAPSMKLTTINPGLVLGPALDKRFGTSLGLVQRLLSGKDPAVPRLQFAIVDVRDVAAMHVRALTTPAAEGRRFIAASGTATMPDLARWLKADFPQKNVTTREAPDFLLRLIGLVDPSIRTIRADLGKRFRISNAAARDVLGMDFIDPHTSTRHSAEFLIDNGLA